MCHRSFNLFPWQWMTVSIFHVLIGHSYVFLCEVLIHLPIFYWGYVYLTMNITGVFIFWIKSFALIYGCNPWKSVPNLTMWRACRRNQLTDWERQSRRMEWILVFDDMKESFYTPTLEPFHFGLLVWERETFLYYFSLSFTVITNKRAQILRFYFISKL